MRLFYSPGACSLGIHVLMEEIGAPYEAREISTRDGEQHSPEYKAINPKSKVPALQRDDGSVLTEFPAIALWLARTNRDKKLVPDDPEAEARVFEAMDYVVATVHMQGFSRMFRPANFAPSEADHEQVKARGREIFEGGLKNLDKTLEGKDFIAGDFSVADAALFYVEFWAAERMKLPLPANIAAHYTRMKARPSVQKAMADEGLA